MKPILFIALFMLSGMYGFTQNTDSLLIRLNELTENTEAEIREKVDILNILGESHLLRRRENPEELIPYAEQAVQLAEKIGYQHGKALALRNLGYSILEIRPITDSARFKSKKYMHEALDIFTGLNDKFNMAGACGHLFLIYWNATDPDKAAEYEQKYTTLYEELGYYNLLAMLFEGMGVKSWQASRMEASRDYFAKALKYRKMEGDDIETARTITLIGDYYLKSRQDYDSALHYYTEALRLVDRSGTSTSKYHCYFLTGNIYTYVLTNLGDMYNKMDEPEKALRFLSQAYPIALSENDSLRITSISVILGSVFTKCKEYDSARFYLDKGHLYFQHCKTKIPQWQERRLLEMDIYLNYSKLYEAIGDYQNAFENFTLYSDVKDGWYSFYYRDRSIQWDIAFESEKKSIENELLKKDKEIRDLKLQQRALINWLLIAGVVILAGILAVILYQYKLRRKINKQLEISINDALERQKQQQKIIVHQSGLTSLGEMAAGIAHEINQPLQHISLAAEKLSLINREKHADEEMGETVSMIESGLERIDRIMEHIRIFASQQKDDIQEWFTVNQCIENAMLLLGKQFEDHLIEVSLLLDESLPHVKGNPYRFEQVVVNLLNNARDALEELQIPGKTVHTKKVSIHTFTENDHVMMKITDNGIGIPAENLTNIFLPFYSTKKNGMGLGLAISYGIIKEMNGMIDVESDAVGGTSFVVRVPGGDGGIRV